ncbi:MAG: dimethyladenosine transferase [Acidobacteriales bacterium]|nr:dimethyladenosine transferase [Terriglobales bacterium]
MSSERRVNVAPVSKKNRASAAMPQKKAKLGQNFLVDPAAAQRIVEALGDISNSIVLEIGPGRGAITKMLSYRAGRLIAIEFDRMLAAQLRIEYSRTPNVEIIEADVLAVDFDTIIQGDLAGISDRQNHPPAKARVVGNLPYYITSDILLKLFKFNRNFDTIVIMVQREVADRISAASGTSNYGLLSATAQLYSDVEKLFTLPPGAFDPPPKVHSSVLRLRVNPKAEKLGVNADQFVSFLKLGFAQKRKTLVNNLKQHFPLERIAEAMKVTGLKPDIRAEAVSLEKMAKLFNLLR